MNPSQKHEPTTILSILIFSYLHLTPLCHVTRYQLLLKARFKVHNKMKLGEGFQPVIAQL